MKDLRDDIHSIVEDEIDRIEWFDSYGEESSKDCLYDVIRDGKEYLSLFNMDEEGQLWDIADEFLKEILEEDWIDKAVDDAKRSQWESEQEARDPYGYRGLRRSDFYSI